MDEERDFFLSTPWCAKLLNDPEFVPCPTPSRRYKSSTEDALFAETLKTSNTISAITTFYRKTAPEATHVEEVRMLVSLEYGVNGWQHIAHGGIVGAILDEAMGGLATFNTRLKNNPKSGDHAQPIADMVTAYLNVTYLKPVSTPQIVLVTARLREIKGTKHYIDGDLKNADGTVLAKAESLFLGLRKGRAML